MCVLLLAISCMCLSQRELHMQHSTECSSSQAYRMAMHAECFHHTKARASSPDCVQQSLEAAVTHSSSIEMLPGSSEFGRHLIVVSSL